MSTRTPRFQLRELDLNTLHPRPDEKTNVEADGMKIIIIGKPGSGKSALIKSILYHKSRIIPCGAIMSGTEETNHFYEKNGMPLDYIYEELNIDAITDFTKRQKLARHYLRNPWSVLVLDDVTDDPKILHNKLFNGIFKNGRHWNMLFIIAVQYAMDLAPGIRNNVDGIFLFREMSQSVREKLWNNYASVIPKEYFNQVMDQITGDHTALYIDITTQERQHWTDCVFYYKAPDPDSYQFRFGADEIWNC